MDLSLHLGDTLLLSCLLVLDCIIGWLFLMGLRLHAILFILVIYSKVTFYLSHLFRSNFSF